MNTRRRAGNTPRVIRNFLRAAPVLALAFAAGCAGPARVPGPPGETRILLENRVAGACELTWVNARVDERPLSLSTIAPPGSKPATLDRPILAPGEHSVTISASASCSAGSGEQPAVLQVTQPVYMGKEGGEITVSISGDPAQSGALKASFEVKGGHVLQPRADGGDVDCRARTPMDWAICRTEVALARAHEKRDVVAALCLGDKLREMRLVRGTLEPGATGLPSENAELRDVGEGAIHRVLALATEADSCAGVEIAPGDGVKVERIPERGAPAFR
jgi:hypothetical protein